MFCSGIGCTSALSSHDNATPSVIIAGMTLAQTVEAKGRHYRAFSGPRTGHIALIYDDVTIHIDGDILPEYGRVNKIEATTPSIEEWVATTPYEDEKKENP